MGQGVHPYLPLLGWIAGSLALFAGTAMVSLRHHFGVSYVMEFRWLHRAALGVVTMSAALLLIGVILQVVVH
jgi:hypothetical protein